MEFEPFGLYDWLLEFENTAKYVLGSSGVQSLPARDLGVQPEALLGGDLGYGELPYRADLGKKVASTFGFAEERVLVTLAGSEADFLTIASIVKAGDKVVVENPTYPPLRAVPKALGCRVTLHQRTWKKRFRLDLGKLEGQLKGAKLLVLSNLNNPTGVGIDKKELEELHAIAEKRKCMVLVDEAFRELAWDVPPVAASVGDRFVSTQTLTKCYGLAGLRTGWILGPEKLVARALVAKKHLTIGQPRLEQALALAALEQRDKLLQRARRICDANYATIKPWLEGHKLLGWVGPDGGPLCSPKLPDGVEDFAIARKLAEERSTLIAPGSLQGLPGHFRLGFGCDPSHLGPGLRNLDEVLVAMAGQEQAAAGKGKAA